MFFRNRRKKPDSETPPAAQSGASPKPAARPPPERPKERRKQYRIANAKAIGVAVKTAGGTYNGEFMDLSIEGLGVRFEPSQDPDLALNDVAEVRVTSMMRGEIRTPVRVVWAKRDGARRSRYGFAFFNSGNLYSQLDVFYARLFNRRRSPRVLPSLDRKIHCTLSWRKQELATLVRQLSATGVGLALPLEEAFRLDGVEEARIAFELPESGVEIAGGVKIRHRGVVGQQMILGLEFDLADPKGIALNLEDLRTYVAVRSADMQRWEQSWGAAKPAPASEPSPKVSGTPKTPGTPRIPWAPKAPVAPKAPSGPPTRRSRK